MAYPKSPLARVNGLFVCFMLMKSIRKKIHYTMMGRKDVVKAIALSLFIKDTIYSSTIKDFSYYKLSAMTGLHPTTLRKRVSLLKRMGLVSFVGARRQHLCFASLSSTGKHRNIYIGYASAYDKSKRLTNKEKIERIENFLFASFVIEIQKRKDFAKQAIRSSIDGHNYQDVKSSRRICKHYGYGREYIELGISLRRIAKEMGVCVKTAIGIIRWAVKERLFKVTRNQIQVYHKGIGFMAKYLGDEATFTFCTKDNEYYILANTYTLFSRALPPASLSV